MGRLRRMTVLGGLAVVALVSSACSDDDGGDEPAATAAPAENASGAEVEIRTFAFQPAELRVAAGTEVVWTNSDDITHTVTTGERDSPDGVIDVDLDGVGATTAHTFDEAGTFQYGCSIHRGMDAVVIVG